jgi:hypothetical protein
MWFSGVNKRKKSEWKEFVLSCHCVDGYHADVEKQNFGYLLKDGGINCWE